MFGTGYYNRKREKNIGFNIKEFVDDFTEKRDTLEETKNHMYGNRKDFSILSVPKIKVDKIRSNDLEYLDKYMDIMESRLKSAEFLKEKAERSNEYNQLRTEMGNVLQFPRGEQARHNSVTIDPYRLWNFLMLNGIKTTLTMPLRGMRENWDDFVRTPLYLMGSLYDNYREYRLDRYAQHKYKQIEENGGLHEDNPYDKVEKFISGNKSSEINIKYMAKSALQLHNMVSKASREDTENIINSLVKDNEIFSFDARSFDIYDKYRPSGGGNYLTSDKEKLVKLGRVADMMDRYNALDEFDVIKINGEEYSKSDYLEEIKRTVVEGFDFSRLDAKAMDYTQHEQYGGEPDEPVEFSDDVSRTADEIAVKTLIGNEISNLLKKRGYNVSDMELSVNIGNDEHGKSVIEVTDTSVKGSPRKFSFPAGDGFKPLDDGKTDLKAIENEIRFGKIPELVSVLDRKYPDTGVDLTEKKDKRKMENDIHISSSLDIGLDDYKFVDDTKMRVQDLPQFKKIASFYEKALNGIPREQIESAIIEKASRAATMSDEDFNMSDDISRMSPEMSELLKTNISNVFYDADKQRGLDLDKGMKSEIENLMDSIKEISSERRAFIKDKKASSVKSEPDKTNDGLMERLEGVSQENWEIHKELYEAGNNVYNSEELERMRQDENYMDDMDI